MADKGAEAEASAPSVAPAPRSRSAADAALDRYRTSMRRGRIVYYAIVGVVVAALISWVAVTWSRGEAAHASLHTASPAPPTLRVQNPSATPQLAWRTSDRLAIGQPQWGGTVITYSAHTVRGRNARTGKPTWSYTRSDRPVCTAAEISDGNGRATTIAVYANHGNCDELSAFDSGTGQRRWTRTLDIDGMPLDGHPTYQTTSGTLLLATHSVVYAIDPGSGLNRWTYQRYGCRIGQVVLGSAGALISQNCSDIVLCKDVKFCGRGPQLLLRNGLDGRDDKNKPNADQIIWNRMGDDAVPVSADSVISAVDPSGNTLQVLDATKGTQTQTVTLAAATSKLSVSATATTSTEVITISGRTYALRPDASRAQWQTDTAAPPTVVSTQGEVPPTLETARVTVPTANGIATLNGSDGKPTQTFTVTPPAPGSLVYPLGTGFLVAGPRSTAAYR